MKELLKFLLIVILLFTFSACSEDENYGTAPDFPVDQYGGLISLEDVNDEINLILQIKKYYYDDGEEAHIHLFSRLEPVDWFFLLENIEIPVQWNEPGDTGWRYGMVEDSEIQNINFQAGSSVNYHMLLNENEFQGELEIIPELVAYWPEFNFDEDYEYQWDISTNPQIFNTGFELTYYTSEENHLFNNWWQLNSEIREFSIDKNAFNHNIVFENYEFYVGIYANNYNIHGACITWTQTGIHYDINSFRGKIKRNIVSKEQLIKNMEIFINQLENNKINKSKKSK